VNLAFRHSTLLRPDLHGAEVTYTDVDGDRITISTPHELQEAFEQLITHPSNTGVTPVVLRVQVTFIKGQKSVAEKRMERKRMSNVAMQSRTEDNSEDKSSDDKSSDDKSSDDKSSDDKSSPDKVMMKRDTNKRGRNGPKWVQMKHALDSFGTDMTETVEKMAKDYENGKKTNLEMQAVIDSLVTNMKATVEKLSEDMGSMQPRKRIGLSTDTCDTDKPFNRVNGNKRRNLKMQGMLGSFVVDMNETIQKLSDLMEEKNGNNADNVSNSEGRKTTTPGYYCSVVGSPDVAEVVMAEKVVAAKEVGKAENAISTSKPSGSANDHTPSVNDGSTRDVNMAGNVTWEIVPPSRK